MTEIGLRMSHPGRKSVSVSHCRSGHFNLSVKDYIYTPGTQHFVEMRGSILPLALDDSESNLLNVLYGKSGQFGTPVL